MITLIPLSIHWFPDPAIFEWGFFTLYYYSLLFAIGLILEGWTIFNVYRKEGMAYPYFRSLCIYIFIGVLLGARLGHCLFYEPLYYIHHIPEIFFPFRFENGQFVITGFRGLASHGGIVGLIVSVGLYCRKHSFRYFKIADIVCIAAPVAGGFIRLGNLMNSEIIGIPTDLPWGFIFEYVDDIPRHPAQLYEALAYFLLFYMNLCFYKKGYRKTGSGFYTGLTICYVFIFRFLIEFVKENQVAFENSFYINMGQILSLPFIVVGLWLVFFYKKKDKVGEV